MTSKERVRAAITRTGPDKVPAAFEAVPSVADRLLREYRLESMEELYKKFDVDILPLEPLYTGPELLSRKNGRGDLIKTSFWGWEDTIHQTETDSYFITSHFPLNGARTVEEIDRHCWPNPDWFDYESIKRSCDANPDKAFVIGHEGPFQIATFLISMDELFLLMAAEPEVAHRIYKRMNDFEMEYYERSFAAADGQIDILRLHDDYGTQISMLFSEPMWRDFFEENTRKLTALAHRYGVFYQQHSCGAVAPLIENFIRCGVDVLEPLQKVEGLEPETLMKTFGGRIAFHGGIDTQGLLPFGTPDQVSAEVRRYIDTLSPSGYILMASQSFEPDVPTENIEAIYSMDRTLQR